MTEEQHRRDEASNAALVLEIRYIKAHVERIEDKLDNKYVTQDEFRPIRMVVYGMVGTLLLSVLTAIVALVIRGGVPTA